MSEYIVDESGESQVGQSKKTTVTLFDPKRRAYWLQRDILNVWQALVLCCGDFDPVEDIPQDMFGSCRNRTIVYVITHSEHLPSSSPRINKLIERAQIALDCIGDGGTLPILGSVVHPNKEALLFARVNLKDFVKWFDGKWGDAPEWLRSATGQIMQQGCEPSQDTDPSHHMIAEKEMRRGRVQMIWTRLSEEEKAYGTARAVLQRLEKWPGLPKVVAKEPTIRTDLDALGLKKITSRKK